MNYTGVAQQVNVFVRPTATTGPTVKQWLLTWLNERLRILYKRRKWRFLEKGFTLTTIPGQSDYDIQPEVGTYDLMIGECYAAGKRLSAFTNTAGTVFYTTPGQPRAIYHRLGGVITLFPQPDGAYPVVIQAFSALPDLTSNAPGDSNYLTNYHAALVIAGGVASAFAQLQELQKAALWEEEYERQVAILAGSDFDSWRTTPQIGPFPQLTFPIVPAQPAQRGQG